MIRYTGGKIVFLVYKFIFMSVTYHNRIKKDYANAVIEDLQKMEAVELLIKQICKKYPTGR